jgi:hypothetical protein
MLIKKKIANSLTDKQEQKDLKKKQKKKRFNIQIKTDHAFITTMRLFDTTSCEFKFSWHGLLPIS